MNTFFFRKADTFPKTGDIYISRDFVKLEQTLKQGIDSNYKDEDGNTALIQA
ncbi:MAG: hypothetical protein KAI81_06470 [Candidatus Marinimicrobia bacterium]|nr:hypothetical protein [Candidatus Neomarinimicrobiota bacterium]